MSPEVGQWVSHILMWIWEISMFKWKCQAMDKDNKPRHVQINCKASEGERKRGTTTTKNSTTKITITYSLKGV